jgi:hypothetical protein
MKKAKFMLTAIAVFGLIGGAFAFKAATLRTLFVGTFNGQPTGACTTEVTAKNFVASGITTVYASTTSLTAGCPSTFTTNVEQ